MNADVLVNQATKLMMIYGPKLVAALFVLIVGSWFINLISKAVSQGMKKAKVDEQLRPFLTGIVSMLMKVMLAISVLGMLGIQMTSFIAILGAAGLAVGMALSGTLQNFAGGVILLLFKPFRAGDFIDAQGYSGIVAEVQIFNTILKTGDNKTIIIPNGSLSTASMTNYSTEATRRVDWTISIAYGDNLDKARAIIKRLCDTDSRILKNPEVLIAVSALADNSVNFVVRVWVQSNDYWDVYFDMNEHIYKAFAQEGLNRPLPQMNVYVHKD